MRTRRLPEQALLGAMLLVLGMVGYGSWSKEYFWQTPDQRAYDDYQRHDYPAAERRFQNTQWKAAACYRRGDFACAAEIYAGDHSVESYYNLGNAVALSRKPGSLTAALASYQKAVQLSPGSPQTTHNQRIIADLLIVQNAKKQSDEDGEPGEPNQTPDDTVVDDKAKHGKPGEISIEKLDPNAIEQLWLRNVKTDPGAFLRLRFAAEQASRSAASGAKP